ncbi:amidohydrolase [Clostridiales bacterium]|nr:amidohydrolase [Clostridiales bacterium]
MNRKEVEPLNDLQRLTLHRRELHKIPELSKTLPKTKAYIKSVLDALDCQIIEVLESGVCAYFDRGKETTIAYRADMDALPVTEVNVCDYASTHQGRMHACGHDAHSAVLLGFAQYVDTQKELPHNVLCVFQPAEETTGGAKDICETGIFQKYNVSRVFGLHLWPFIDAGKIASKSGPMMPRSSEITIEVFGRSSHATAPEKGIDALFIASQYIQQLYDAHRAGMRPNPTPEERTIIQICKMESGTARNVISGYSTLLGTMRAFSDEDFAGLVQLLEDTAQRLSVEYGCRITAEHSEGYPPVVNDPALYQSLLPALRQGLDYEEMPIPAMISEDYSFYGLEVPSVFFFLGTGTGIALHSNNFDFDEKILVQGLEMYKLLLRQ